MKLKSFFAASVGAALSLARREMGGEAILVQARRSPPEARHLGECEVVVGVTQGAAAAAAAAPAGASPRSEVPDAGRLLTELADLRREVQRMAALIGRAGLAARSRDLLPSELAEIFSTLISAEMDAELAQDVMSRLRAADVADEPEDLRECLAAELESRFSADSRLGRSTESPRVVALVGPPGAGKTMTLVKLAVRYGLTARRPTQLISVDSFRVAGGEELRSYAAILGIGFQALEGAAALRQALAEHRHKDLVLIDTPGYGVRDMDAASDLAGFLVSEAAVDTHLVLTASMKSADLSHTVDRFAVFSPQKLIFTRLDETASFGPLLSQAARSGMAVSFLANGQQIPEDLEPATKGRIVDLVLNGDGG